MKKTINEDFKILERPGYSGRQISERIKQWNEKYGKNNWDMKWKWGEIWLDFEGACRIYEDAYYEDSFNKEKIWKEIFSKAYDVYDNAETNIDSGFDYNIQEAFSTHIQDIAVRNVGKRRGWKFKGDELIQIRGPESEGYQLSPGRVPFHMPKMIIRPDIIPPWADPNSTEAWYQNAKYLVLLKNDNLD